MAGIAEAQQRWQIIRSQGRTRGIIALVVAVVVVLGIALVAKSNAAIVLVIIMVAVVLLGAIAVVLGKKQTGLSITPEWKPKDERHFDDDDDLDGTGESTSSAPATPEEPGEPIRRLDAQILGVDLTKLGQVVNPKLAKSYAMGYLELTSGKLVWEPSVATTAKGIEQLAAAPAEVASVESAPLWGSWAIVRVVKTDGSEWCMRVPGSVDLAPAFSELGLTLKVLQPES